MRVPSLRTLAIAALAITTWLVLPIAAQTPRDVFERARLLDESNQNLAEAITLYSQVAKQATDDRPLAANATLRVGVLSQRLGRFTDAQTAFETVIRVYPDQTEPARLARARLAPAAGGPAAPQSDPAFAVTPLEVEGAPRTLLGISIAPDGKRMAAIGTGQMALNVAAYDFDTRALTVLTRYARPDVAMYPTSSPDGSEMAFAFGSTAAPRGPMELRAVTMGGAVRTLTRSADNERLVPTDWLNDGTAIVVLAYKADGTCGVGLVPAAGGPYAPLGPASCGDLKVTFTPRPIASPDSKMIALEVGPLGRRSIAIIGLDGQTVSTIADHPADDSQPFWSPDGRHLVFLSARSGSWALWGTAMDNGQAVGETFKIRDGMRAAFLLGWSSRGLTYFELDFGSDVFTQELDPRIGSAIGAPTLVEYQHTGLNFSPAWSPDGKHMAFVELDAQTGGARRFVVTLARADKKAREFLIPTSTFVDMQGPRNLRWFSDNSGIGFAGLNDKRQPTVFRLTLATGAWETTPLPEDGPIDWMLDGTAFLYVAGKGTAQARLVAHDFATGQERQLSGVTAAFGSFRLAPDGKSVAFSQRGDNKGVFVMNLGTGQVRQIAATEGSVTWSPDGRRLVISQTNDRGQTGGLLATFDLATESSTVVWREPPPAAGVDYQLAGQAEWSPDGTHLIFNQIRSRHLYWNLASPVPPVVRAAGKERSR